MGVSMRELKVDRAVRVLIGTLASLALVLGGGATAVAVDQDAAAGGESAAMQADGDVVIMAVAEDGTRYCSGITPDPYVRWRVSGDAYVQPPRSSVVYHYNHSSAWWTGSQQGIRPGGYWRVTGEFNLDVSYTTAYCSPP